MAYQFGIPVWCASFGGFYWLPVYIVASLLPQIRCASFGGFHCLPPCMPNSLLPHLGVQVLTVLLLTIFFVTIVLLCKFCRFINRLHLKTYRIKENEHNDFKN